jgi:hypothetical protein
MYYDFVRIHKTLRTTPAMAAGITSRLWEIGDIVDVLEAWEQKNGSRLQGMQRADWLACHTARAVGQRTQAAQIPVT